MEGCLPDYHNSILNLVSSIGKTYGIKTKYKPLKLLDINELKESKNIVLFIVDGLGYKYLTEKATYSMLNKYLKGKITSAFPSATSSALTALLTGDTSDEHAVTSWYCYYKELGVVGLALPYLSRVSKMPLSMTYDIKKAYNVKSFMSRIPKKVTCYLVNDENVCDSDYSQLTGDRAKRIGYKNIGNCFNKIKKIIKSHYRKKFIFVHFPKHDTYCHDYGSKSKKVKDNFKEFDKKLTSFFKSLKGTNTSVIISADHGSIDIPKDRKIVLNDHPKLKECLRVILCGDLRYAFCFVKPDKTKDFEKYVKGKLGFCCNLYKSKDLVKKKLFGLLEPSEKFLERIGDYTIIMKENYTIYEFLDSEERNFNKGDHGGLSEEEMFVPLVYFKQ